MLAAHPVMAPSSTERQERQRRVREAVKRHGRQMKDFGPKPLRVLRDLERDPDEAAAVAMRMQDALAAATATSATWQHFVANALVEWAQDLSRPDAERDALLDGLRARHERFDRYLAVEETLDALGEMRCYLNDLNACRLRYIPKNPQLSFSLDACLESDAVPVLQRYVDGSGSPDRAEMERACRELTRCAKVEQARIRAREVELNGALKELGLGRRKDSTLCDAFVRGTSGKTAREVAQVMAKFRYLYSGQCAEFNKVMERYVIRDYRPRRSSRYESYYEYDSECYDSDYSDSEDGMTMVDENVMHDVQFVSKRVYNEFRRDFAADWTDLPAVWPWLTYHVVRMQRRWRAILASPYTAAGKRRLRREFDALASAP